MAFLETMLRRSVVMKSRIGLFGSGLSSWEVTLRDWLRANGGEGGEEGGGAARSGLLMARPSPIWKISPTIISRVAVSALQ